jgi:Phosphoserine phosphatase RsbU, N-terminal domain
VTDSKQQRFQRDYAPAFLRYLSQRSERELREAYELGRMALAEQLSMLALARIHHTVLLDVLKSHRTVEELEDISQAASEFLVEVLAAFEMAQRGFMELRAAASPQPENHRNRQVTE